jgi:hypothetical protein
LTGFSVIKRLFKVKVICHKKYGFHNVFSRSFHYNIDRIFDDFHFNIRERSQWGRERRDWTVDSDLRTYIYKYLTDFRGSSKAKYVMVTIQN